MFFTVKNFCAVNRTKHKPLKSMEGCRRVENQYNIVKIGPYGPELIWHFGT